MALPAPRRQEQELIQRVGWMRGRRKAEGCRRDWNTKEGRRTACRQEGEPRASTVANSINNCNLPALRVLGSFLSFFVDLSLPPLGMLLGLTKLVLLHHLGYLLFVGIHLEVRLHLLQVDLVTIPKLYDLVEGEYQLERSRCDFTL